MLTCILVLERLKQEDPKFKATLSYTVRLSEKQTINERIGRDWALARGRKRTLLSPLTDFSS